MRKYNKNGIAPFDAKNVLIGDVEDETVIQVYTENGTKMVHYFGYGYYAEDDGPKSYRWVDYTFLIATAKDIIAAGGITAWESENQDDCKQYIEDCTEEEIVRGYKEFDAGNPPDGYLNEQSFSETTPDGVYVVDPTVQEFKMNLTVRFNREITKDDYIVPGGYEITVPWETINFDFVNSESTIDEKDKTIVHFNSYNLDYDSFPALCRLTMSKLKDIKEIQELFVYTGEEIEGDIPRVVEIVSVDFISAEGSEKIEVPQALIDKYNMNHLNNNEKKETDENNEASFADEVLDSEEYAERIGLPRKSLTWDEFESLETDFWTYPISEVEHIIENGLHVVLVRFPNHDNGGSVYRWCELE